MVVLGLGLSESFRLLLTSVKGNGMMWECGDVALVLSLALSKNVMLDTPSTSLFDWYSHV